jgi:hypothetical protein
MELGRYLEYITQDFILGYYHPPPSGLLHLQVRQTPLSGQYLANS